MLFCWAFDASKNNIQQQQQQHSFHKTIKQLFSTIIIRTDIEDYSNDAENSQNRKLILIGNNILQFYCYNIFDQINAASKIKHILFYINTLKHFDSSL